MPEFSRYVMNAMADRMRRMNDNLRAAQTVEGVNARVIANASLSMERTPRFRPSVRQQRVASLSNGNAAARAARKGHSHDRRGHARVQGATRR
jgi:hypothetical protein